MAKVKLSQEQQIQCHAIIHTASAAAGATGIVLAQVPLSDAAVITPIQIGMIVSLGAVFGIKVTEGFAKGIITSCGAAFIGRGISQLLVGWIPGIGNIINTTTAAGLTEAIGWLAVKHFHEDRDKIEWKKEGYEEASRVYEVKFQKQAEEFINQKVIFQNQTEEYEELLDTYAECIHTLQRKHDRSKEDYQQLKDMIAIRSKLKSLPKESRLMLTRGNSYE